METQIIHVVNLPEVLTAIPRFPDQNPAFVYLASLPARSGRNSQRQVIEKMAAWLGGTMESIEWGQLRYAYTIALKTRVLDAGYSPASARKFMAALRGILKAARRLGQIPAEEYASAIDWGRIGATSLPQGRYIEVDEIGRILDACVADKSSNGARDAAMFAILYGCGLRREELINLDLADYKPEAGTLLVHGKRGKDRLSYVTDGTQDALHDWISVRGTQPGPLFLAVFANHAIRPDRRLTTQTIYNTVVMRAKECGVENFSPHSLRRSFCSALLDAGVDISTAQKLMGHANIHTTSLYDRRGDHVLKEGAQLLHIPYKKRKEGEQ